MKSRLNASTLMTVVVFTGTGVLLLAMMLSGMGEPKQTLSARNALESPLPGTRSPFATQSPVITRVSNLSPIEAAIESQSQLWPSIGEEPRVVLTRALGLKDLQELGLARGYEPGPEWHNDRLELVLLKGSFDISYFTSKHNPEARDATMTPAAFVVVVFNLDKGVIFTSLVSTYGDDIEVKALLDMAGEKPIERPTHAP